MESLALTAATNTICQRKFLHNVITTNLLHYHSILG